MFGFISACMKFLWEFKSYICTIACRDEKHRCLSEWVIIIQKAFLWTLHYFATSATNLNDGIKAWNILNIFFWNNFHLFLDPHCVTNEGIVKFVGETWIKKHHSLSHIRWRCSCIGNGREDCRDIGQVYHLRLLVPLDGNIIAVLKLCWQKICGNRVQKAID